MIVISGGDGDDSWSGFLEKLWVVCPPNLPCARDDNVGVVSRGKPEIQNDCHNYGSLNKQ